MFFVDVQTYISGIHRKGVIYCAGVQRKVKVLHCTTYLPVLRVCSTRYDTWGYSVHRVLHERDASTCPYKMKYKAARQRGNAPRYMLLYIHVWHTLCVHTDPYMYCY